MNTRRTAVVGLLVAAGLGLAACTTGTPTGTPSASSSTATQVAPADQLTAAFAKLTTQGYDVTVTEFGSGLNAHASVDPTRKAATEDVKADLGASGGTIEVTAVQIDGKLWVKLNLGQLQAQTGVDPTKWLLIDASKLKPDNLPFDPSSPDLLALAGLFSGVSNVTRTDATHLSGTVDLTKATGPNKPNESDVSGAGDAAKAVPFTATLDDQGRLTELKITPDSGHGALAQDITISNYGSPSPINPPADADVVPTPPAVYAFLNQ